MTHHRGNRSTELKLLWILKSEAARKAQQKADLFRQTASLTAGRKAITKTDRNATPCGVADRDYLATIPI